MEQRIIIIGGGPVGLALALTLAKKYQQKSLIIEKRLEPTPIHESRAIIWMPKGIEFLQWLSMLDSFKKVATTRTCHHFRSHGKPVLMLDFKLANSPFKYSLNLPQHFSESLLETETKTFPDLIEIRRGHELTCLTQNEEGVVIKILNHNTNQAYELSTTILVGADGAKSKTRESADIKLDWLDYGTFSAVADIEANLPSESTDNSWIELDHKRPFGLFNFHPNKWRIIYRVNEEETREEVVTPAYVDNLIKKHFPQIGEYKFLWASAFRLGQGQSHQYSKGRIVLVGDAAHPMGPSAGAGMMVGMLGVWRLAWRLKKSIAKNNIATITKNFKEYEAEQRSGSKTIQSANASTFKQISLKNNYLDTFRKVALFLISQLKFVRKKIIITDTLTNQKISCE